MGENRNQGIAVTILVGIAAFFIFPLSLSPLLTRPAWVYVPIFMGCYLMVAFVLGFVWKQLSWRIGLWLFLIWPPALLLAYYLAADAGPWNWKGELLSLSAYALMLMAACFGAWLGAAISSSREKKLTMASPSDVR